MRQREKGSRLLRSSWGAWNALIRRWQPGKLSLNLGQSLFLPSIPFGFPCLGLWVEGKVRWGQASVSNAELHLLQKLGGCLEPHSNTLFSEVPCVWFSSQQASQRTSPGEGPWQAPELVAEQQPASMPGRFPCRKQGSPVEQLSHCVFALAPSTPAAFMLPQVPGFSKQGWQCFWC